MSTNNLKNIAIFGASGNIGREILIALQNESRFNITVIQRADSKATLPAGPSTQVRTGDLESREFLASALGSQDAVVFALSYVVPPSVTTMIIDVAAEVGIKWIVPSEFGSDLSHKELVAKVGFIMQPMLQTRQYIESKGLSWLGVATSSWIDFNIPRETYYISPSQRKATILTGRTSKFTTTSLAAAGLATARLLSLPLHSDSGPSLSSYANSSIYVQSFRLSQEEILAAIQAVSGTTPEQWTVDYKDIDEETRERVAGFAKGEISFENMRGAIIGNAMKDEMGGDFSRLRKLSNRELGLPEEDLDEVVKKALAEVK